MKLDTTVFLRFKELFRLWLIFIALALFFTAGSVFSLKLFLSMKVKKDIISLISPCIEITNRIMSEKINNRSGLIKLFENYADTAVKSPLITTIQLKDLMGKTLITESQYEQKQNTQNDIFKITHSIKINGDLVAYVMVWYDYGYALKKYVPVSHLLIIILINLIISMTAVLIFVDIKLIQPLRIAAGNIGKILDWDAKKSKDENALKRIKRFQGKTTEIVEIISETQEIMNMIFDISRAFTSNLEIAEIIDVVLEIIRKRFDPISVAIVEMSEDDSLRVKSQRGFSREFVRTTRIKVGEGMVGKVYESMRASIINDISKQGDAFTQELGEQEHVKSVLYIPLLLEHHPMGVLIAASDQRSYFDFRKVKTLTMIAESTSIAMRNAKLYEQLQGFNRRLEAEVSSTTQELTQTNTRLIKKVRELKALYDIAFATAKRMNLDEVIELVIERIQEILNVEYISFILNDEKTNELVTQKLMIRGEFLDTQEHNIKLIDSGIYTHVFRSGEAYVSNKMIKEDNVNLGLPSDYMMRSILCMPLKTKFKTTGLFCFGNKIDSPFNEDDIRLITVLCNHTSEVIENIKLYQENKRRVQDLTTMQEVYMSVSSSVGLPEILDKISSIIIREFDASASIFLLYDELSNELIVQDGSKLNDNKPLQKISVSLNGKKSLPAAMFKIGEPTIFSRDETSDYLIEAFETDFKSAVVVPLKAENKVIGVLYIGSTKKQAFEMEHLRLAILISDQTASIIEKAQLYEKLREAVNDQRRINVIKNQFLANVTQELSLPLDALEGFFNVIVSQEAGELNKKQSRFLDLAGQSIARLRMLIKDLLDVSSVESGILEMKKTTCFVPDLVNKAVANMTHLAVAKEQIITVKTEDGISKITADTDRIVQVFENLLSNSIKFTPPKGSINLLVREDKLGVHIHVRDTGIGVPKKDHHKIFDKFYQVDDPAHKESHGSGLGLSLVKLILNLHQGKIEFESEENEGCEFIITLPVTV